MYKYFAWRDEYGWRGQKLIGLGAVESMRRLMAKKEHFASPLTYDETGKILFCPLYADFDGASALEDVRYAVHLIGEMANVIPDIYFSGNKGFHLIIPFKVTGDRCYLVSRYFFEYLAKDLPTLDKSVYHTRALLRMLGSPASREGYFKVQISKSELFGLSLDQIRELARTNQNREIDECDVSKLTQEFHTVLQDAVRNLPEWKVRPAYSATFGSEITPCIERMIDEEPTQGWRNQTVQLLARFLKKVNFTEEGAMEFLLAREHWKAYEDRERGVSKAVASIFRSKREVLLGCRTGRDAELMKEKCHSLCWWNEHRMQIRFGTSRTEAIEPGWLLPRVACGKTEVRPEIGGNLHAEEPAAAAPLRVG